MKLMSLNGKSISKQLAISRIRVDDFIFVVTPPLLFVVSLLYSLLLLGGLLPGGALSFLYTTILLVVTILNVGKLRFRANVVSINYVFLLLLAIHLGFLITFGLMHGPDDYLWVPDSYNIHLPNAISVRNWISNGGEIEVFGENPFEKILFSNMWVGVFFYLFGVSPIVSATAFIPIKLLTVLLIYKTANNLLHDKFIALTGAILYVLTPAIIVYTLQFYKEFFIHFLIALAFYIFSESIKRPWVSVLIALPLGGLFVERFYLVVMLLAGFGAYVFINSKSLHTKLLISAISAVGVIGVFNYYFKGQGLLELVSTIDAFREAHNEAEDVTPTINIWVDLFRITFTPFFSLKKLDSWSRFDSMMIFGTFLQQAVMALYFWGLLRARKWRFAILNVSLGVFVVLYANIAPYGGRERDSFYPLIVIFASVGLASVFGRYRHGGTGRNEANAARNSSFQALPPA